jgi:Ca2+-binding EF-hand superfamily protein
VFSPVFFFFFTLMCLPLTGAHSILDQALPDDSITDRQAKNNSNVGGPFSQKRRGVPDEVYLARSLRKLARKLKHGGHDLNKFRNQIDMSKKDFQRQLRTVLQMKTTRREMDALFVFFDKDNSNTLSGGEIMSHFFDTKHVEEMIRKVCDEYPDLMKENKTTKTNTPGGRNAQRDPDGKWGVTGGAGMQNRLLNNFLAKIDSILMYRRPDLSNFKRQALTKEYFGSQILHVFGLKHTQEELNVLFNFFDKDGDGTLDYVEVYRRFFAKTRTGRKPEDVGPPKTIYAGQVFKYVAPDEDPVSDEENEEVDAQVTQMIQKNLPPLLQGDGELAIVLRKISLAWDQGEWYWGGGVLCDEHVD